MQKSGNHAQAEVLYLQVLRDEPGNPFCLYGLGTIEMARNNMEKAIPRLQESLQNGYVAETVYTNLGIALQVTGRLEEALHAYAEGSKFDPKNPRYPSNAAVVLAQQGKFDQAFSKVQHAIALDPAFVAAYINAGEILQSMGRKDEARNMYEKASQLDPGNQVARDVLDRFQKETTPS